MSKKAGKRDSTKEKQTVKFFETFLRASTDGIAITNETQSIILANEAFCSLFDRRLRDVLETNLFDWLEQLEGNAPERWTEMEKNVYLEGFCRDIEFQKKTKEGTRYLNVNASILERLADEESGVIISTWRDISKNKRVELEAQSRQAQKFESLNVLAGSIAHNFNNLLMVVLGNLELAREELPPGSSSSTNIGRAEIAARRASKLSRLMLTYVGQNTGEFQTINVNKLIGGMAEILKVSVSDRATLKINPSPAPVYFKGDPGQVHELIINFITNAVEALGNNKGTITLSCGTMHCDRSCFRPPFDENLPEGDYAYIEIVDDGCGMDGETLAKVFDPYFTTKFTGRGMGLAAVLGIMRAHKGAVTLKSKPGKGTAARALFPTCVAPEEPQKIIPAKSPPWQGSGTILLVDDEESFLEVGKAMLESMGYRVLTAPSGFEAVEIFRESRDEIVCVILDIIMPCVGGKDVFLELREIRKNVPVIFCSAYPEEQLNRKFADILPVVFIEKPFRRRDLAEKIKKALKL